MKWGRDETNKKGLACWGLLCGSASQKKRTALLGTEDGRSSVNKETGRLGNGLWTWSGKNIFIDRITNFFLYCKTVCVIKLHFLCSHQWQPGRRYRPTKTLACTVRHPLVGSHCSTSYFGKADWFYNVSHASDGSQCTTYQYTCLTTHWMPLAERVCCNTEAQRTCVKRMLFMRGGHTLGATWPGGACQTPKEAVQTHTTHTQMLSLE